MSARTSLAAAALLCMVAAPLAAQSSAERPPPRTPDGKPDLSGMWVTAPANALPCGRGVVECGIELPMSREGGYMGASLPGGLPYQPWAAELVKQHMATSAKDDPHGLCLPDTFLRAYGLPHIVKFVQTPQLLIALEETIIEGIPTTIPFHLEALRHPRFAAGDLDTRFVEALFAEKAKGPEAASPAASPG